MLGKTEQHRAMKSTSSTENNTLSVSFRNESCVGDVCYDIPRHRNQNRHLNAPVRWFLTAWFCNARVVSVRSSEAKHLSFLLGQLYGTSGTSAVQTRTSKRTPSAAVQQEHQRWTVKSLLRCTQKTVYTCWTYRFGLQQTQTFGCLPTMGPRQRAFQYTRGLCQPTHPYYRTCGKQYPNMNSNHVSPCWQIHPQSFRPPWHVCTATSTARPSCQMRKARNWTSAF